jgi:predicted P-loop ATPase
MAIPTTRPVMTLGRIRTMTMRMGGEPIEVEASTNDSSFTASVWPRTKRAKPGAKTKARAREVSFTEVPRTATTARASTSGGKARPASVARMRR